MGGQAADKLYKKTNSFKRQLRIYTRTKHKQALMKTSVQKSVAPSVSFAYNVVPTWLHLADQRGHSGVGRLRACALLTC